MTRNITTYNPTIVLVHGSWHVASSFDPLRQELEKLSFTTIARNAPSATESSEQQSATAEKDAEYLRRSVLEPLIAEEQEIVLVMHSYGGIYGSAAVQEHMGVSERRRRGLRGGVLGLVYIAAFAAPAGLSSLAIFGASDVPLNREKNVDLRHSHTRKHQQNFILKSSQAEQNLLTWTGSYEKSYHDLPQDDVDRWTKQAVKTPFRHTESPVNYLAWNSPAFHQKRAYIFCEHDHAIPSEIQRGMVANADIEHTVSFDASHSPFASMPKETAGAVADFVRQFAT